MGRHSATTENCHFFNENNSEFCYFHYSLTVSSTLSALSPLLLAKLSTSTPTKKLFSFSKSSPAEVLEKQSDLDKLQKSRPSE